jgi:PAS domain S-box-containing protein
LKDEDIAKEQQLIKELRLRIAEYEKSETRCERIQKKLKRQAGDQQEPSTENVQRMVHEQKTHKIELEMQKEELRKAQDELEEERNKYANLYDFAPIGYFTFDKNGLIIDVNLSGANKLGVERSFLINKPFSLYVAFNSRDVFYLHLGQVFKTRARKTCEIKLVDKNKNQFYAQLESLLLQDRGVNFSQCRTALSDITERKKAGEESSLLASIVESSDDAIIIKKLDGMILNWNLGAQQIYGFTAKEVKGRSISILIPPDKADEVPQLLQRVRQGQRIEHYETVRMRKDGKQIDVSLTISPIKDSTGKIIGASTIVRDITENKQMDKALRESEARYRELAESIDEVFFAMDRDLRYIYWNNASEKLTGISAKDAVGKSLFELFPELKNARAEKSYIEVLKTHQPQRFVHKYKVDDKNLFFEMNAYPSKFGISVIAKNITERERAEEQIREQASLLDKAQDAIGVRDIKHRLIYWNKGAQHLYGWMAEEVMGKNADELLYKEESPLLIEAKKSVIEKGEWIGELPQIRKDGKEIIVESRWSLIHDNEGKPKSILIISTDITEKKKLESQLLRAQRMESIGTLASGIAHDLNNVMTPMMLSVDLLKEKFKDEQSQRLLTILEKNSQRGANLIKQVMSFARGVEVERKPIQAKNIITEIETVIKETFPKSIEIRTDIQKDLSAIYGNSTQLYQVLMNLCVNARDAMPEGGILNISAENFLIDDDYARMNMDAKVGSYIVITVSDTGTGIPPEIMDRIFEPFFTTKEQGKGTGLGLSTSLGIVKSHSGFINVCSEVGQGTKFSVYLPVTTTTEGQKAEDKLGLPFGKGELILLVDDEAPIREITRATLEAYGYKVITANEGAEAAALYAQNIEETRIVLMDMAMPNMDGLTSIRVLRKINPKVKIIAASGLTEKEKLTKVADINADAFLPKPYTADKLLKTIREVIVSK